MAKEFPQEVDRSPIVRISEPAGGYHEVNLNDLLKCCKDELERRERAFPYQVAEKKMTEKKAQRELERMRSLCDFLVHCIFKAVTRQKAPARTE